VFVIKQNTFVQSNTTHVYSINLIAITYTLHVLAYTYTIFRHVNTRTYTGRYNNI